MFYENDRIARKQARYIRIEATKLIESFQDKGLSDDEVKAALELLSNDKENTEIKVDIINKAISILEKR